MQQTNAGKDWAALNFEQFEKALNGEASSKLHALRRRAFARFVELGFPTIKDEEWRFTNVAPIASARFNPVLRYDPSAVSQRDVDRLSLRMPESHRLVFVDGHFAAEFSVLGHLPSGAVVTGLADGLDQSRHIVDSHLAKFAAFDNNAFTALNTAFVQDGAFVFVPDGVNVSGIIHLLFLSSGAQQPFISVPRNLIIAGTNSKLTVVEAYHCLTDNTYFTNAVTEVMVGAGAVVEHDKLQCESERSFHVGTMHVYQGSNSTYCGNSISLGGALVRNNVNAFLGAEGSECTLNGLSLATGRQHVDNHTAIDHAKPRCVSHELYKAILDGTARGVFNGKIFVRKDAQKTDAKQTNKTLLLSDDAMIDTKPQLEIFADDVKCTHGATVGQLDEEQLFYLRSRGVGLEEARDVLTYAFASDVIHRVHAGPLRMQLEGLLQTRLRAGRIQRNSDETAD